MTLTKEIRDRLGIKSHDEISAIPRWVGPPNQPNSSLKLETAPTGRENWENTIPTDAGAALFGPMDQLATLQ